MVAVKMLVEEEAAKTCWADRPVSGRGISLIGARDMQSLNGE
jgi:hypothetical protein